MFKFRIWPVLICTTYGRKRCIKSIHNRSNSPVEFLLILVNKHHILSKFVFQKRIFSVTGLSIFNKVIASFKGSGLAYIPEKCMMGGGAGVLS